jgi:NADH dehydrogenase
LENFRCGGCAEADLRRGLRPTLLETAPRILGAFPEAVSTAATSHLRALGVNVSGVKVVAAGMRGYVLSGGERVPAAMRVWATGIGAIEQPRREWTGTEPRGPAIGRPRSGGPRRAVHFRRGGLRLPRTGGRGAVSAVNRPGRQTAGSTSDPPFPAWLQDGTHMPPFRFRDFGALVAPSDYTAFGTLGRFGFFKGGFIKNRFAQLSHALLYRRHELSLHGPRRAALMWLAERIIAAMLPAQLKRERNACLAGRGHWPRSLVARCRMKEK